MSGNYVGRAPGPSSVFAAVLVGCIMWRHSVGVGMLHANGQTVAKATYPELWTYAQGFLTADQVANPGLYRDVDAANFALPKLDGLFIRSQGQFDANRASAALGVRQDGANMAHQHNQTNFNNTNNQHESTTGPTPGNAYATASSGTGTIIKTGVTGDSETRPINVALVPCILTGRT